MKKLTFFLPLFLLLWGCSDSEPHEIENYKTTKVDSCALRDTSINLSHEIENIISKHPNKSGAYVLEDGGGSLITRAWLTDQAQKSIDIQYFIFSTDNVGLIACDYLVKAADRGVKVRILIDDIMVEAGANELLTLDAHKNIEIKIFNPGLNVGKNIFSKLTKLSTDFVNANKRMHNKTFIIDNQIVITGGRNIADEYFDYDHDYNFRDRDVLLMGKVTQSVNHSFEEFWDYKLSVPVSKLVDIKKNKKDLTDPQLYDALHNYACDPGNFWPQIRQRIYHFPSTFKLLEEQGKFIWLDDLYFVSDSPDKNQSKIIDGGGITTDSLLSLINQAKHSLDIQSPYLVTTELSRSAFRKAVKRGVKIRILTNSLASTDNLEAFSGYQRDRNALLETGVEIYEFKPDAKSRYQVMTGALQKKMDFTPVFGLHAKTMVVDKKICVIGTFNLDPRSAHLNTECITIMHSEEISKGVLKGMDIEFSEDNSWHITKSFNPDHTVKESKRLKTWTRKVVPKDIL